MIARRSLASAGSAQPSQVARGLLPALARAARIDGPLTFDRRQAAGLLARAVAEPGGAS